MADKKVTKREVINAMLNDDSIRANQMFVDYLVHEIELLDNKAQKKTMTKIQSENVGIKETILGVLKASTGMLSISDIQSADEELKAFTNQKISALLSQMVRVDNTVVRTEVKKVPYFSANR